MVSSDHILLRGYKRFPFVLPFLHTKQGQCIATSQCNAVQYSTINIYDLKPKTYNRVNSFLIASINTEHRRHNKSSLWKNICIGHLIWNRCIKESGHLRVSAHCLCWLTRLNKAFLMGCYWFAWCALVKSWMFFVMSYSVMCGAKACLPCVCVLSNSPVPSLLQITRCLSQSWFPVGQGRVSMAEVKLGWARWCHHGLRVEGWGLAWWSTSSPPRQLTNWTPASGKDPTWVWVLPVSIHLCYQRHTSTAITLNPLYMAAALIMTSLTFHLTTCGSITLLITLTLSLVNQSLSNWQQDLFPYPYPSGLPLSTFFFFHTPSITVMLSPPLYLFSTVAVIFIASLWLHRGRGTERWRRRRGRSQRRRLRGRNWKSWQKVKVMSSATSSTPMGCLCRMAWTWMSKSLGRTVCFHHPPTTVLK